MTGHRPEPARRGRPRLILVVGLLAVLLSLALAAALRYVQVDEIELPDLRGLQFDEAAAILRERNLVPVSYPDNVPSAPVESVTTQTPPPGAVVRRGRTVSIGVHRPPEASRAPLLLGLTADQALNTAGAVNLALERVEYLHSNQPPGRVIEQRPEPGERLTAGQGLSIVVSRGPSQATVVMPDLVGVPLERARERLQELGLRSVQGVAVGVSFDSPGRVTAQEPEAGEEVSSGSPVLLSYDLSAREVVPVPELSGRGAEEAGELLRAAGLRLGELVYVDDEGLPRGSVISNSPSGFTLRGTPVELTINADSGAFDELRRGFTDEARASTDDDLQPPNGSPADRELAAEQEDEVDGRRINVTFDPATLGVRTLMERDYDLQLVVQDDEGERTVLDRRVRAGESVSAVVVVQGDALLQTYINGVFFQAWRP